MNLLLRTQRSAILGLQALTHRLRPATRKPRHLQLGERGELEALFFLRSLGYVVVERRWRTPDLNGDLDLVAYEGETLVIVEVKARSARTITPAASAVDDSKRRMLIRMARAYRRTLPRERRDEILLRFDVVSVYMDTAGPVCELIRDAFDAGATNEFVRHGV